MRDKITVALIGAGRIGLEHAKNLASILLLLETTVAAPQADPPPLNKQSSPHRRGRTAGDAHRAGQITEVRVLNVAGPLPMVAARQAFPSR